MEQVKFLSFWVIEKVNRHCEEERSDDEAISLGLLRHSLTLVPRNDENTNYLFVSVIVNSYVTGGGALLYGYN
ncbi:hypothetical protein KJ678_00735 [Patescibacteria group bacterium]|nr:hypothetical protein [Patescibacteria group bacterium]